ncbi:hypothetical protein Tco_0840114 [Tanacetum coccineum]|uniref:Xylulose kinase-1 n=1 Tax=Tanacetum coccineum TaxID=301880 RepID=A0ABQ5AVM8_9ASTR
MAPLTFADTYNMVAYLSKSDASEGFDQILDFLNTSTIRYALTVNPTIYVSCIKQFWSTAKVKTVNGVVQLQALIDGKKVFVSEAIIRRDLHLEDAKGVKCLPNNEIFEELARMSLQRKVDALEKDKLAQATEILSLKKRVEKLEKRRKSKPSVLRRLRKIGSATRVESLEEASLGAEENASKQGGMISDIDADAEISLVDETQRLDDDLIFDTTADLGGEEVVVKPAETGVSAALDVEVSAAEPAVTTVSSLVTTDSVTITAVEPVSAAAKELTDNDMTMAEALAELKTSKPKVVTTVPILNSATTVTTTKPKAKGITIQEPSVTQKTTVSFISSSKGKAIMIESEKPVELEEEAKRQEEASMAALAELYDAVQAQIDADQELAARMTLEEHEKYTVEERARMLAEFIKIRKK